MTAVCLHTAVDLYHSTTQINETGLRRQGEPPFHEAGDDVGVVMCLGLMASLAPQLSSRGNMVAAHEAVIEKGRHHGPTHPVRWTEVCGPTTCPPFHPPPRSPSGTSNAKKRGALAKRVGTNHCAGEAEPGLRGMFKLSD